MSTLGQDSTISNNSKPNTDAPDTPQDALVTPLHANGTKQDSTQVPANGTSSRNIPTFSPATTEILKRVSANSLAAATSGTPGWEAAREQVLKSMVTSDTFATPPVQASGTREGRGGKTASPVGNGASMDISTPSAPNAPTEQSTLVPGSGRGRGRGRGRGSGRGSGRGRGRGGGRSGKRKRDEDDVIKAEDDSDDSENYTPLATMTKSGRAVQKPTTFTPPVPSPASGVKRKRPMNRKNPELAVCKVCLRPHSPASNMIVFCDGCNTPYHRYCHHPPIEQEAVDVPEMEWFCAECRVDRAPPVTETAVGTFVSSEGASESQVRCAPLSESERSRLIIATAKSIPPNTSTLDTRLSSHHGINTAPLNSTFRSNTQARLLTPATNLNGTTRSPKKHNPLSIHNNS